MEVIRYNKLVRDKIPDIIRKNDAVPIISTLNSKRFVSELKKKLLEESNELLAAKGRDPIINELADVLEVLVSIAQAEKIAWQKVERERRQKKTKRGGFNRRLFLKEVRQADK